MASRSRLGPEDLVLCAGTVPTAPFRAHAEGLSDADLRTILADHALVVTDVEAITDFGSCFRGGAAAAREPTPLERLAYEVAVAVGATTVTLVEGPGPAI